ncbi:MAG: (2Fe-2S)-binding protein [Bdellovibrionales bacterium]|nr:(2Fe-2S)-binding protein [Bdellovibrionales bacterium]
MSVNFIRISKDPAVKISQSQSFDAGYCLQGLNILGHAQLIDLFIGSECGGQGRCGKDRIQISEPERIHYNPPTELEHRYLSDALIADGWRLACQCFPAEDGLSLTVYFTG